MKKNIILSAVMVLSLGILGACNSSTPTDNNNQDIVENNEAGYDEDDANINDEDTNEDSNTYYLENLEVSIDEAISVFEAEFPEAFITNVDLEWALGDSYYEIEGVDNEGEHELRINAVTGEIERLNSEPLDLGDTNLSDLEGLISVSEVINIVHEMYPEATITNVDIDRSLTNVHWEVDVRHSTFDHGELKIDAQSGDIIELER